LQGKGAKAGDVQPDKQVVAKKDKKVCFSD